MNLLLDAIEALRPTRPDLARRLADALIQVQAGEPVLEALELDSASRRAERDRALYQAAVIGWPGLWQAAGALAAYSQGRRSGRLDGLVLRLVEHAERCATLPGSRRQFWNILEREHGRSGSSLVGDHDRGASGPGNLGAGDHRHTDPESIAA